jgi:hypothetical protein
VRKSGEEREEQADGENCTMRNFIFVPFNKYRMSTNSWTNYEV